MLVRRPSRGHHEAGIVALGIEVAGPTAQAQWRGARAPA